jgi:DNA polymerase-3 subunit beta
MKLTVARKDLYEGLQTVSRVVSSHTSLPVLKNVLIEPGVNAVKLAATDLELGVECVVPASVSEGDSITVPAKLLAEIVSGLPEADVSLAADDHNDLVLCCGRAEYRIHGLPAEDFPALPEVGGEVTLSVPQPLLKAMIHQTAFATSKDETRPILTGVCIALTDGQLRLVATDTHRLAVRTAPVLDAAGERTVIVPVRALNELVRVLADADDLSVHLRIDSNQIMFRTERFTLVSRLIEGQFPRYERVIPSGHSRTLTIPREDLQAVVRRARIVARDAAAANRVVLRTSGESLVITAEAGEVGRAYEEIEILREGDDIEIAFNAAYLLDVLGVLTSESVQLEMNEPLSPSVLRPSEGADYLMVIMPMQIQ